VIPESGWTAAEKKEYENVKKGPFYARRLYIDAAESVLRGSGAPLKDRADLNKAIENLYAAERAYLDTKVQDKIPEAIKKVMEAKDLVNAEEVKYGAIEAAKLIIANQTYKETPKFMDIIQKFKMAAIGVK